MGSGGGGTSTQYVKSETSNLPAYAQPYYTDLLNRAQANLSTPYQPYQDASGNPIQRIAGFTPQQQQVQQNILNQQTPGQFGAASNLSAAAGLCSSRVMYRLEVKMRLRWVLPKQATIQI